MNLNQAKQLIEFGHFASYENSCNRSPCTSDWSHCFHVISQSRELSDLVRYEYLVRLKARVNLSKKSTRGLLLTQKIDQTLPRIFKKRDVELKKKCDGLCRMHEQLAYKEGLTLYTHLVLDSVVPQEWPEKSMSPSTALAFLRKSLVDFAEIVGKANPSDSSFLQGIGEVLKDTISCRYIIREWLKRDNKIFVFHQSLLEELMMSRVEEMIKGTGPKPPFLLFSLSNSGHAVMAVITYSKEKKFSITLVNTGEGAIEDATGDKAQDLVLSELEKEDVNSLIQFALKKEVDSMEEFMRDFRAAFANTSGKVSLGDPHSFQRGSSCASKSAIRSLRLVMPERLYRSFKLFYSSKLHAEINSKSHLELGEKVLQKRTIKAAF